MADAEKLSLSEWLVSLRQELRTAKRDGESADDITFVVEHIEVELAITSSREHGGRAGVRFWVVDGGLDGRAGSEHVQRVRLSLKAVGDDGELMIRDDLDEVPE
jgi:hypothetical protein